VVRKDRQRITLAALYYRAIAPLMLLELRGQLEAVREEAEWAGYRVQTAALYGWPILGQLEDVRDWWRGKVARLEERVSWWQEQTGRGERT
jgi:hypothetical protein